MLTNDTNLRHLLDGVIDLERLRSGPIDSLERDARKFLDLTYLSEDLHKDAPRAQPAIQGRRSWHRTCPGGKGFG